MECAFGVVSQKFFAEVRDGNAGPFRLCSLENPARGSDGPTGRRRLWVSFPRVRGRWRGLHPGLFSAAPPERNAGALRSIFIVFGGPKRHEHSGQAFNSGVERFALDDRRYLGFG